jgi:hypothetical protein
VEVRVLQDHLHRASHKHGGRQNERHLPPSLALPMPE